MTERNQEPARRGQRFLTSQEAAELLGVTPQTLYAYVSRGQIRSVESASDSRARRYAREDVERLIQRRDLRRSPSEAAKTALDWGAPVLETAISSIDDDRFYYRGLDVLQLARERSVEEVIGLLWTGELVSITVESTARVREVVTSIRGLADTLGDDLVELAQACLPLIEIDDPRAHDLRPEALIQTGRGIMALLIELAISAGDIGPDVATTLQSCWCPGDPAARDLISAALILSADHELNISSFTARCIASARSPLYAAVSGGMAALRGQNHGGVIYRVEALLREVEQEGDITRALVRRLRRGERIPGFGHRLYPDGDPRASLLLQLLRERGEASAADRLPQAIVESAAELIDERPNIDFALAALNRALGRPRGTAITLMLLGHAIGWIAHALEEYERNRLIRPRARYIGRPVS